MEIGRLSRITVGNYSEIIKWLMKMKKKKKKRVHEVYNTNGFSNFFVNKFINLLSEREEETKRKLRFQVVSLQRTERAFYCINVQFSFLSFMV